MGCEPAREIRAVEGALRRKGSPTSDCAATGKSSPVGRIKPQRRRSQDDGEAKLRAHNSTQRSTRIVVPISTPLTKSGIRQEARAPRYLDVGVRGFVNGTICID
jgi:hypothetical protein